MSFIAFHLFAFAAKDAIIEPLKIKETETMKALFRPLTVLACFCLLSLTGCGQRGDLTLPTAEVNQPAPATPAASKVPAAEPVRPQPSTDHQLSTNR
jgi:predicted small lipoprotein YifL